MTADPSKPEPSTLGCLFRIGVGIFALSIPLAVVVCVYALREHQKHQDALSAEFQLIRSNKEPLDSNDLADFYRLPDGVPDITAVYLAALAPLENEQLFGQLNRLKPLCTLHRPGQEPPHRPEPWSQLTQAEAELEPFQDFLRKVEEAAKHDGGVRYPVDFAKGWDAPVTQAILCRSALPALELQTICYYQRGEFSRAAGMVIAMMRLGESLRYEPLLSSQLARLSILQVATRLTTYLAADAEFPEADLKRIQTARETVEFESIRMPVFLGERAGAHITHNQPADAERAADYKLPTGIVLIKSRPGDSATLLRWQRKGIDVAKLPLPQAMPAARQVKQDFVLECSQAERLPRWMQNHVAKREYLFPDTLLRWLGGAESENRALIAFCACERFHRVHNKYPAKLDELVPDFLDSVPQDPFVVQPLSMIRWDAENYGIYSFGDDGQDDQGQGITKSHLGPDFGVRNHVRSSMP